MTRPQFVDSCYVCSNLGFHQHQMVDESSSNPDIPGDLASPKLIPQ
jgi:hypothetical protein